MHIKIKKNHQKIIHHSLKYKLSRKYSCMSKIFPKIDLKFYSNVTNYNSQPNFLIFKLGLFKELEKGKVQGF